MEMLPYAYGYECDSRNISWVERLDILFNEATPSWIEQVQSFNKWNMCTIARIKPLFVLYNTFSIILILCCHRVIVYYTTPVDVIVDYHTISPCDRRLSHGDVTILISSKGCRITQVTNGFNRAIVKIFHLLKDWTCSIQLGFASLNRKFNLSTHEILLLLHSHPFIICKLSNGHTMW